MLKLLAAFLIATSLFSISDGAWARSNLEPSTVSELSARSSSSRSHVSVRGHYRKNGTYVAPHYRSAPNKSKLDNWSTKGNVNPYTGKVGTKNP
jgi:hypothetical protein